MRASNTYATSILSSPRSCHHHQTLLPTQENISTFQRQLYYGRQRSCAEGILDNVTILSYLQKSMLVAGSQNIGICQELSSLSPTSSLNSNTYPPRLIRTNTASETFAWLTQTAGRRALRGHFITYLDVRRSRILWSCWVGTEKWHLQIYNLDISWPFCEWEI